METCLKKKCSPEHYLQLSFKLFVKIICYFHVSVKGIKDSDENFNSYSLVLWVNPLQHSRWSFPRISDDWQWFDMLCLCSFMFTIVGFVRCYKTNLTSQSG